MGDGDKEDQFWARKIFRYINLTYTFQMAVHGARGEYFGILHLLYHAKETKQPTFSNAALWKDTNEMLHKHVYPVMLFEEQKMNFEDMWMHFLKYLRRYYFCIADFEIR